MRWEVFALGYSVLFLVLIVLSDTGALSRIQGELILWANYLPPPESSLVSIDPSSGTIRVECP